MLKGSSMEFLNWSKTSASGTAELTRKSENASERKRMLVRMVAIGGVMNEGFLAGLLMGFQISHYS